MSLPKYAPQFYSLVIKILSVDVDLWGKQALYPEDTSQTQECNLGRNLLNCFTLRKSVFITSLCREQVTGELQALHHNSRNDIMEKERKVMRKGANMWP